jgi:hypothetical protein
MKFRGPQALNDTLGSRARGESANTRPAPVSLDWTRCARQCQPRHRRRDEGASARSPVSFLDGRLYFRVNGRRGFGRRELGLRDKSSRPVTESRSSDGNLLLEHLSLSAGDSNFRAGVEPNRKSTVARWFNAFDILQVDNRASVGTKENGWVEALLHVVEIPSNHGMTHSEMHARVIALRFEDH